MVRNVWKILDILYTVHKVDFAFIRELTDAEDGEWVSDKDVESPVTLTLSADQPVYDSGVLKVNISWSAGQSRTVAVHVWKSLLMCSNKSDAQLHMTYLVHIRLLF